MGFINNLKFVQKLVLLMLVPVLVLSYFALTQVLEALDKRSEAQQLERLEVLAARTGELVHELQKERGLTAGFIGSSGREFRSELASQRELSDQKLKALRDYATGLDAAVLGKTLAELLDKSLERMQQLAGIRSRVDTSAIEVRDAIGFYTQTNAQFLSLVPELSKVSSDADITLLNTAYYSLLEGKERAGIERAVLSAVFASDRFGPGQYAQFLELVAAQEAYLKQYKALTTEQGLNFFNGKMNGEFISETERMRQIAKDRADMGGFGIDSAQWFRMQTGKINLLADVEIQMEKDLIDTAAQLAARANNQLLQVSAIALGGILFSILLGWYLARNILRQLGAEPAYLEDIANHIAQGNLDIEIKGGDKAKTGIFSAVSTMRDNLRTQIAAEREVAAVNLRLKVALDNVSSSVMVADAKHNVIYLNNSGQTMFSTIERDLRRDIPGFDARSLIGSNMDQFHKSPAHQRSLIDRLNAPHHAEFVVGGRTMKFIANPVVDTDGTRLGTVVEWADRTAEVEVEQEVDGIIASARSGDLARRIDTRNKTDFFLKLSQGINELIGVVEEVFDNIARVMKAMSGGNLTQPIEADYQGTYGEVKEAVNETIVKLESIVSQLLETADVIATGADEINSGNNNLSQRTEQQAANLEETAASMEELTSTVRNNADNAQQANQVSANARQLAEKGGEVVSRAVSAMSEINASSNKIAEIIGVIDEIAFQTNLLALNASVEAARAGDQGRGFAVVATEVRNLASRSAAAAKEIKELIQDSVEKVKGGSELVNESGSTLQEIVLGVKQVGDIIAEIAAASAEQSSGIDQVNQAVTAMDEVTQQNAALAEQTSAASASMTEKAREMEELMGFFTVSGRNSGRAAYKPAPARSAAPRQPARPAAKGPAARTALAAPGKVKPSRIAPVHEEGDDEWEEF
jgi:methyl-accepting chemotaxis protein